MDSCYGTLYIVATPIGNLEDITFRAVRILQTVDLIAAEDTRRTKILLKHYNISNTLVSYHEHNQRYQGKNLLKKLLSGKSIALVSDAGTPAISDPGYLLSNLAVENSVKVVPIPGVSAITTALSISGLPSDRFTFEGFLPRKETHRRKFIQNLKDENRTIIFYESPYRIIATLENFFEIYGERWIVIARELTKVFEEIIRGPISCVLQELKTKKRKGEFTVLISSARFSEKRLCSEG